MIACIDGGLVCIPTLLVCVCAAAIGKKFVKVCKRSCKCACHPKPKEDFTNSLAERYEDFHVSQIVNVRGESFTKGEVRHIKPGAYIRVQDEDSEETADVYPSQLSVNTDSIMHG